MKNIALRRCTRITVLSLGLAAGMAFASTALADPAPASAPAPAEAVEVKAAASYTPTSQEQADYLGRYKLSTGKVIEISQAGRGYYSEIDGRMPAALYPRGPGVFVTASGATITFSNDGAQLVISRTGRNLTAAR